MSNFSCEEFLIFLSYALLKLTVFIEKPDTCGWLCLEERAQGRVPSLPFREGLSRLPVRWSGAGPAR